MKKKVLPINWLMMRRLFCLTVFLVGESSAFHAGPSLSDQMNQAPYPTNKMIHCEKYIPTTDPGRIRNEAYFSGVYGRTTADVRRKLVTVYWMPKYFSHKYPLQITTVNGVNLKLKAISDRLELLVENHPKYLQYLDHPSGAFYWRHIQNTNRRSPHSYGIAIDLNSDHANYWIWDTGIKENELDQVDKFEYRNHIPCEIVSIFEDEKFIWGGKWAHYDTMHFEYRPEMFLPAR